MNETNNRYLEPLSEISSRVQLTQATTSPVVNYDPKRPWVKARNPQAGINESRWVVAHPSRVNQFAGRWIAVLGDRILVDGPTIRHVYDFLKGHGYVDALVMKVPTAAAAQRYRIARADN